jgi:hypothetical protein
MIDELIANPLDSQEILMIFLVSLIGANIREYLFAREEGHRFFLSPQMWISTIISTFVCYCIDPWVISVSPRLVLLPPLILGLAGIDIARRLSSLKGITSLIEWVVGFFGIQNAGHENGDKGIKDEEEKEEEKKEEQPSPQEDSMMSIPISAVVTPTINFSQLKNLDDMVVSVLDSICNLLVAYYATKDTETFLKGYFIIMKNKDIMDNTIRELQVIHSATALKLSEIVKKEIELKRVYDNITAEPSK